MSRISLWSVFGGYPVTSIQRFSKFEHHRRRRSASALSLLEVLISRDTAQSRSLHRLLPIEGHHNVKGSTPVTMTAFNWEYVAAHPFRFSFIMLEFGLHSISLSIRRLLTFWRTKPTNFVTAWKSLLLRIFMHRDYRYVYTASKAEIKAARRVDAPGVEAYVVSQYPTRSLASFDAVILYCHGGGYVIGEPLQCYSSFVRWTKKASQKGLNLAVFSIRYRKVICVTLEVEPELKFPTALTGDKPFPAQRDTALGAYDYLIKQEDVSPKNIIISGDSAGGKALYASCNNCKPWVD